MPSLGCKVERTREAPAQGRRGHERLQRKGGEDTRGSSARAPLVAPHVRYIRHRRPHSRPARLAMKSFILGGGRGLRCLVRYIRLAIDGFSGQPGSSGLASKALQGPGAGRGGVGAWQVCGVETAVLGVGEYSVPVCCSVCCSSLIHK